VDVREESFDILRTIGWGVIENERVFPHVHHKDWYEARDISHFVQRDPMIRDHPGIRILVTDGPANAAHVSDTDKIRLPEVVATETRFRGLSEVRFRGWHARALLFQVPEIMFMKNHAIVFDSNPPSEFRLGS